MAIVKSDQLTNEESTPKVLNPARDKDARKRCMVYTFTSNLEAAGSTIRFGTLKKGWRLLGMRITAPICGGAGATLSLGVSGTVAKYLGATAIDAALSADANHTDALFHGEVLAADTEIIGTTAVGALLAAKAIVLVVNYTRD